MVLVIIPATLRDSCAGASKIEVPGTTVGDVLRAVDSRCPGFYNRVVEEGRIRPELAFAINGEVYPMALHNTLAEGAEIAIVPALGGGAG